MCTSKLRYVTSVFLVQAGDSLLGYLIQLVFNTNANLVTTVSPACLQPG